MRVEVALHVEAFPTHGALEGTIASARGRSSAWFAVVHRSDVLLETSNGGEELRADSTLVRAVRLAVHGCTVRVQRHLEYTNTDTDFC